MNRSIFIYFFLVFAASVTGSCKKNDSNNSSHQYTEKPQIQSFQIFSNKKVDTVTTFVATVTNGDTYLWDFGDGTTSTSKDTARHTYHQTGRYVPLLIVSNNIGSDSAYNPLGIMNFRGSDIFGYYSITDSCSNPIHYSGSISPVGPWSDILALDNHMIQEATTRAATLQGDSLIFETFITNSAANNYQPDTISTWGVVDIAHFKIYMTTRQQITMWGTSYDFKCNAVYSKQ
jgi:PKD repeat protein